MADTVVTALITTVAALGGVLVTVLADGLKDRRRVQREDEERTRDRRESSAARRDAFELQNLLAAYDGLSLLARECTKIHLVDVRAARSTEHGYGGTRLPAGTETDLAVTREASKAIRLVLNDRLRSLAGEAQEALTWVSMVGVVARGEGRNASVDEGEVAYQAAVASVDAALKAMADRIRELAGS
jgi:hypothetical protein